ncbi:hypothetical protein I2I05_04340 [Hymenobacter sp. BT683]|uniref:Uracil-DNA glycosylase-like domain-containing protein n=1 Tax=Hymenobacter jeongseonensis TaxID=2791027 RepID=A0ABS0IFC1_9BACT|nr:hypothetical protein [Hymenobacter jeongseonensis]MBF9236618.1 hypothetical protein [Hymenobacter jeongseonensis]
MTDKQITSFDDSLSTVSGLNWLPWIGEKFPQTGVLLVGESFYEDGDGWLSQKDATRKLVENHGLNSFQAKFAKSRFFRNTESTLLAQPTSSFAERERVWTSVSYLNLVQQPMASRKIRPTVEDFDLGWQVLLDVAKIIQPQVCIRLGIAGIGRLGHLLATKTTGWQYDSGDFKKRPLVINLRHGDYRLKIVCVNHPSGSFGYKYQAWAKVIIEAIPLDFNN